MNWERVQDNWPCIRQRMQQRWGKLTDADIAPAQDQRDELSRRIQQRYGVHVDEAHRQISSWERKATEVWFAAECAKKPVAE